MNFTRLVVTGAPGAGKTTFVQSVSEIGVINTDRRATDHLAALKDRTTVAFDFGRLKTGGIEVQVYGTPGQARFSFMWELLAHRAHAYLLLVDAHRPDDFAQTIAIRDFFASRVPHLPMAVGITHLDCPGAFQIDEIMLRLGYCAGGTLNPRAQCILRPLVIAIDAENSRSVNRAVNYLLMTMFMSKRQAPEPAFRSSSSNLYSPPPAPTIRKPMLTYQR